MTSVGFVTMPTFAHAAHATSPLARDQGRGGVASSWCRYVWPPSVLTLLDAKSRHRQSTPRETTPKFVVGGCPQLVLDLPSPRS